MKGLTIQQDSVASIGHLARDSRQRVDDGEDGKLPVLPSNLHGLVRGARRTLD
jgi:hypothetical protein